MNRKEGRTYSFPPGPRRIASRICPGSISDRHRIHDVLQFTAQMLSEIIEAKELGQGHIRFLVGLAAPPEVLAPDPAEKGPIPFESSAAITALEGQRSGRGESDLDCESVPGSPCR